MISAYIIFTIFLLSIICILSYKLYQFSLIILRLEDVIEESLDELDERYKSIGKILQQEIFFDSVEIRQVINDIRLTHNVILNIANRLISNVRNSSEIEEKNDIKK